MLVQIENVIESSAAQSLGTPRVVVKMSTNNSTEEAVARMPRQRTMEGRIPNPLSTSVSNNPDALKIRIGGKPLHAFDSGKKTPSALVFLKQRKT